MQDHSLLETGLADCHRQLGARMVEFFGWVMPVQYTSIKEEHVHTRRACSIFDVSHMGRVKLIGNDDARAVARLCPVDVEGLQEGQASYSFLLTDEGTTVDDLLVTREMDGWGLVINAANRPTDIAWMREHIQDLDVRLHDFTEETVMIAVQGPAAVQVVRRLVAEDPDGLGYYEARPDAIAGQLGIVSRTGYTGEDGFELVVARAHGPIVWNHLLAMEEVRPAGLGARDTLRLEAAMPLYGHELTREISPIEAGLKRFVHTDNQDFIGRDAVLALQEAGRQRKCVCLKGEGRKVPREGAILLRDGRQVGTVTSGTFSPTFECPIAMGYVETAIKLKARLQAEVRGKSVDLRVVKRPFFKREKT